MRGFLVELLLTQSASTCPLDPAKNTIHCTPQRPRRFDYSIAIDAAPQKIPSRGDSGCQNTPKLTFGTFMGWVNTALEKLATGQKVDIRPHGGSMRGLIESGQLVTLSPIQHQLEEGDIVLVRVRGSYLLHLIKEIDQDRYLIGNNLGKLNGWAKRSDIFGIVVDVQDLPSLNIMSTIR